MAMRFKKRKRPNVAGIITSITTLVLTLWVGSDIISAVALSMNNTNSIFATALGLLGFEHTGSLMGDSVSTTGLVSIIGLIAVFGLILSFIKIQFGR
jgi:hypothetical protein